MKVIFLDKLVNRNISKKQA